MRATRVIQLVLCSMVVLAFCWCVMPARAQEEAPDSGGEFVIQQQRVTLEFEPSPIDGGGAVNQAAEAQDETKAAAITAPTHLLNYQGRLYQSGSPVTGTVSMVFSLYTEPSGGTAFWTETRSVSVSNGLFTVLLGQVTPLTQKAVSFAYQAYLGINPASAGELAPRQPLGWAAYAMCLLPGATMYDDTPSGVYVYSFFVRSANHNGIFGSAGLSSNVAGQFSNTAATTTSGCALRGYSAGGGDADVHPGGLFWDAAGEFAGPNGVIGSAKPSGGHGVIGIANSAGGCAGYFYNRSTGYDIHAAGTGMIRSDADSIFTFHAHDIVTYPNSDVTLQYWANPFTEIVPTATGGSAVFLPCPLPKTLYGVGMRVKRIKVVYDGSNTGSYINYTQVRTNDASGGQTTLIDDQTDRTSTSWSSYTVTDTTPGLVDGSIFIYFNLQFAGTGGGHSIRISTVELTLSQ